MTRKDTTIPVTAAEIETEIQRIQSLGLDGLRSLWCETFKKNLPRALARDLLVRMLAWHIQEQAFGGYDRATLKILDSYARGRTGEAQKARYLKPGTEVVREFQGERHTVVVTSEGFRWRGGDYFSLTAIARIITGTSCNGPRFFGLRTDGEDDPVGAGQGGGGRQKLAVGHKKIVGGRP